MMRRVVTRLRNLVTSEGIGEGTGAEAGTLRLILKSRKVARIARVKVPQPSLADPHGRLYSTPKYVTFFDYEFEEDQLKVLKESRELAERTGLRLELVDFTRQSPLRRLVMRAGGIDAPGVVLQLGQNKEGCPAVETPHLWRWP